MRSPAWLDGRERYEQKAAEHIAYMFRKALRRSRSIGSRTKLAETITSTYPGWWARAEEINAEAIVRPSLSRERRALDA